MSTSSRPLANMLARKFVLAKHFQGLPKLADFQIVEEIVPSEIGDGEILASAEYLSVDPVMRGRMYSAMKIGDTFGGTQVARVIKSKNDEFPEGSQVVGNFGWRTLSIYKPEPNGPRNYTTLHKIPELKGLPDSYALGCLGMPGNTAYHGFLDVLHPKAGETLVVSAAAGCVGSLVSQIGKIKGCKVLGFAGSEDKVKWLKNDCGIDHAFNYKKVDLDQTFKKFAPEGLDMYFDNVGSDFVYHVVQNMKEFGRISQCGSISTYNKDPTPGQVIMEPFDYMTFRFKQLKMEGFNVRRWYDSWFDGIYEIRDWILEGKINVQETRVEGFENMHQAFIDLLEGKNTGKMIVKA